MIESNGVTLLEYSLQRKRKCNLVNITVIRHIYCSTTMHTQPTLTHTYKNRDNHQENFVPVLPSGRDKPNKVLLDCFIMARTVSIIE